MMICETCGEKVRPSGGTRYVLDWGHEKMPKSGWHRAIPVQMGDPSRLLKTEMIDWIKALQVEVERAHRAKADQDYRDRVWDDYH